MKHRAHRPRRPKIRPRLDGAHFPCGCEVRFQGEEMRVWACWPGCAVARSAVTMMTDLGVPIVDEEGNPQ